MRKIAAYGEEIPIEDYKPIKDRCIIGAVMAIIKNLYAGLGAIHT